jgi:hypothetical protein
MDHAAPPSRIGRPQYAALDDLECVLAELAEGAPERTVFVVYDAQLGWYAGDRIARVDPARGVRLGLDAALDVDRFRPTLGGAVAALAAARFCSVRVTARLFKTRTRPPSATPSKVRGDA